MKTTKRYPLTREDCDLAISHAVKAFGPNATKSYGYRREGVPGTGGGTIAFSFVKSPRGERYRRIEFC